MTVVFADLVGFTSRAESLDPEDVQRDPGAVPRAPSRTSSSATAGTVEKFIGDAVVAVFGAPVVHEDDAERAVRAALAIRDWARRGGGRRGADRGQHRRGARLASTPGPSRARAWSPATSSTRPRGCSPRRRSTASSSARRRDAPPSAPSTTPRPSPSTRRARPSPCVVSEAVAARARFGVDLGETARTPLVGRARELDLLRSALARVRDEQAPHLVTLVGVPGIGKSRLVRELFDEVERDPDLIGWRQGRSLPYGEGVTYWALAEMVKAQAGILESDDPAEVAEQAARPVGELVGADEAVWVEPHLRTLLGQGDQRGDTRADAFAAWQRYLEGIADTGPARARVRGCALGRRRPARLHRPPRRLGDRRAAAARLHGAAGAHRPPSRLGRGQAQCDDGVALAALSGRHGPARPRTPRQGRPAGRRPGAPFGARRRQPAVRRGVRPRQRRAGDRRRRAPAPRLDPVADRRANRRAVRRGEGRPRGRGCDRQALLVGLGRCARRRSTGKRSTLRCTRSRAGSSFSASAARPIAGESQYAFRHLLVRDVAYGQIPRARRAEKHRLAAEWIASLGRPEEQSELLAHHYLSALEFARAAGQDVDALAVGARTPLREAGDRALALNADRSAARFYRAALELWPPDDPLRPELLLSLGRATEPTNEAGALEVLEEARAGLLAAGKDDRAAEADVLLADLSLAPRRGGGGEGPPRRCRSAHRERPALAVESVRDEPDRPLPHAREPLRRGDALRDGRARDGRPSSGSTTSAPMR